MNPTKKTLPCLLLSAIALAACEAPPPDRVDEAAIDPAIDSAIDSAADSAADSAVDSASQVTTEISAPAYLSSTGIVPAPREPQSAGPQLQDLLRTVEAASTHRLASQGWNGVQAEPDRENYAAFEENGVRLVVDKPVSTFSIDVDTGAYSNARRLLNQGRLPPAEAVRAEEMINYFAYAYPIPADPARPFAIHTEVAPSPWNAGRHLLQVGLQGWAPPAGERPNANLVFLVDVSGSMQSPDKLGLLRSSLKLLTSQLREDDRISLVTYAGASAVVLQGVAGNEDEKIEAALNRLRAGGGTNGGAGIEQAYALARESFIPEGINRVILATDGDFNLGVTSFDHLKAMIEEKRRGGVTLTTLGFGGGNYNDHLMEQLADAGNGNHAYIDTLHEARKVLVDELASTLQVIASDVKIQIEFNPAVVSEYRLVGYENRLLRREDFNDDKVDAGEVGAGHSVTALYEISLAEGGALSVDPLRYQTRPAPAAADMNELAYLKLRYKRPGETASVLDDLAIPRQDILDDMGAAGDDWRFAAAVAGFAQLLRGGARLGEFDYDQVLELAAGARGDDPFGYRAEFLNLMRSAGLLDDDI